MSVSEKIIHEGMEEIKTYLKSKIPDTVFEVSNSNTIEYFLGERYNGKSLIVLLEFMGFPISKIGKNSEVDFRFEPRISAQVYASVMNNHKVNFIKASETLMLIAKYVAGYVTTNFGKLTIPDQDVIPIETYANTGNTAYKISWGLPLEFRGLIKLKTNTIGD